MLCRDVRKEDLGGISRLNAQQDFKIKDIDNHIIDKIILKDEKEIAYGIVKHFAEAIILLDLEIPKITRMKALRKLLEYAIWGTQRRGIKQLHCFVSDTRLAEVLKKHYGFIESKEIVLVKNL